MLCTFDTLKSLAVKKKTQKLLCDNKHCQLHLLVHNQSTTTMLPCLHTNFRVLHHFNYDINQSMIPIPLHPSQYSF